MPRSGFPGLRPAATTGLALLLLGPFLVTLPEPDDEVPVRELADADSHFLQLGDVTVHYRRAGSGEPVYLLLHGFAASTFSWREIMEPLARQGTVIAYDRPGFGLTERPLQWQQRNPYSNAAQAGIAADVLAALDVDRAIVVGNSAGGTVAAQLAVRYPERVEALVLVSPAIYSRSGVPGWLGWLMRSAWMNRVGPWLVRLFREPGVRLAHRAWHDPGRITPEIQAGYELFLQGENWDRALWQVLAHSATVPELAAQLAAQPVPVLVVSGAEDRVIPTRDSEALAQQLDARLVLIPGCGHVAQEECPGAFLAALQQFVTGLQDTATGP